LSVKLWFRPIIRDGTVYATFGEGRQRDPEGKFLPQADHGPRLPGLIGRAGVQLIKRFRLLPSAFGIGSKGNSTKPFIVTLRAPGRTASPLFPPRAGMFPLSLPVLVHHCM
jgi:hypothetical protein